VAAGGGGAAESVSAGAGGAAGEIRTAPDAVARSSAAAGVVVARIGEPGDPGGGDATGIAGLYPLCEPRGPSCGAGGVRGVSRGAQPVGAVVDDGARGDAVGGGDVQQREPQFQSAAVRRRVCARRLAGDASTSDASDDAAGVRSGVVDGSFAAAAVGDLATWERAAGLRARGDGAGDGGGAESAGGTGAAGGEAFRARVRDGVADGSGVDRAAEDAVARSDAEPVRDERPAG
jgi:hypothetical protein